MLAVGCWLFAIGCLSFTVYMLVPVIFFYLLHAVLEALDTLAKTIHELGNLLPAKQQQYDECDDNHLLHAYSK